MSKVLSQSRARLQEQPPCPPRHRHTFPNIFNAANPPNQPLEAHSEPSMQCTSILPQILVPLIGPSIHQPRLGHILPKDVDTLFPHTPTNEFTNMWHQKIEARNRLPVVVQPHVKRLQAHRIVRDEHRPFNERLRQPPPMLALQRLPLLGRILKLHPSALQLLDSFSVRHTRPPVLLAKRFLQRLQISSVRVSFPYTLHVLLLVTSGPTTFRNMASTNLHTSLTSSPCWINGPLHFEHPKFRKVSPRSRRFSAETG